jgi:cyanate lyase
VSRAEATAAILAAKREKGLSWADVAAAAGRSKEWVAAACLGQMTLDAAQAAAIGDLLTLPAEAVAMLQVVPSRGSLPAAIPSDPLVYRFYELVSVYGTTLKELIAEEFGDGIMSAIDFSMSVEREPHPAGDRVHIVMSGKFLPYKQY